MPTHPLLSRARARSPSGPIGPASRRGLGSLNGWLATEGLGLRLPLIAARYAPDAWATAWVRGYHPRDGSDVLTLMTGIVEGLSPAWPVDDWAWDAWLTEAQAEAGADGEVGLNPALDGEMRVYWGVPLYYPFAFDLDKHRDDIGELLLAVSIPALRIWAHDRWEEEALYAAMDERLPEDTNTLARAVFEGLTEEAFDRIVSDADGLFAREGPPLDAVPLLIRYVANITGDDWLDIGVEADEPYIVIPWALADFQRVRGEIAAAEASLRRLNALFDRVREPDGLARYLYLLHLTLRATREEDDMVGKSSTETRTTTADMPETMSRDDENQKEEEKDMATRVLHGDVPGALADVPADAIDIGVFEKAFVLKALYDGARAFEVTALYEPGPLGLTQARAIIAHGTPDHDLNADGLRFGTVLGRVLCVDLDGDHLDPEGYDRHYGVGAARARLAAATRDAITALDTSRDAAAADGRHTSTLDAEPARIPFPTEGEIPPRRPGYRVIEESLARAWGFDTALGLTHEEDGIPAELTLSTNRQWNYIVRTKHDEQGRPYYHDMISVGHVKAAASEARQAAYLRERGTIVDGPFGGGAFWKIVYFEERHAAVVKQTGHKNMRYEITVPRHILCAVWTAHRQTYYMFAVNRLPEAGCEKDPLYAMPLYNVDHSGWVCMGTIILPPPRKHLAAVSPETILLRDVDRIIIDESTYTNAYGARKSRKHPESLESLWAEMHRRPEKTPYDMADLTSVGTVGDLLGGTMALRVQS